MKGFILVGHDCAYGRYPAPAIPIGYLGKDLVAIYSGEAEEPQIEYLELTSKFKKHPRSLRKRLASFRPGFDRLFAYSSADICFYDKNQERAFFEEFLSSPKWRNCEPFLRLMLAEQVGLPTLIRSEVEACFQILSRTAPNTAPAWYQNALATVEKHKAGKEQTLEYRVTRGAHQTTGMPWGVDRRMLIVEDQDDFGEVLADKFRLNGFHVFVARDGVQAIEQVESNKPEIVLLDLMLPLKSGYEVLEYIRDNTTQILVLCVSALPKATHSQRAIQLGANAYLTKPTPLPAITRAVRDLIAKAK